MKYGTVPANLGLIRSRRLQFPFRNECQYTYDHSASNIDLQCRDIIWQAGGGGE